MDIRETLDKRLKDLCESPVTIPTPAPTKPKTVPELEPDHTPAPAPIEPDRKPKRDPFKPRKPKEHPTPEPKNQMVLFLEEYDDLVHPSVSKFWSNLPRDKSHKFSNHPIMAVYGDKLSKDAYRHTRDRMLKFNVDVRQLQELFHRILTIEQQHSGELEDLAVHAVSQVWDYPVDRLMGSLGSDVDINASDEIEVDDSIDDELRRKINKRITMNALTQGSAVHNMMTLHHLVRNELQSISPDLLELYDIISPGAHGMYWMIDISAIASNLANSAVGSVRLDFGDAEDASPTIVAKALIFPVLCQELSKGVMEVLTYHQFSDYEGDEVSKVMKHADSIKDEPFLIQVGPALWRKFLAVVNKVDGPSLAEVVAALAAEDPDTVHDFIMKVLDERDDEAVELLNNLIS